jgi:hypothetical protein
LGKLKQGNKETAIKSRQFPSAKDQIKENTGRQSNIKQTNNNIQ